MATRLREQIYTPLSENETRELVTEAWQLLDGLLSEESKAPDDEDYVELDVLDDLSLEAEGSLPVDARGRPEALERLAACRSTLTLEYYGRIFEAKLFIALQKLLFARVGKAVVWSGEGGEEPPTKGAKIVTLETLVSEREKYVGPTWRKTPPLGTSDEPERKPHKTRKPKPGELEALAVHKRLVRVISGTDPFAREALKKALEHTTPQVRAYAAALREHGPTPDAALAKELGRSSTEIASDRDALRVLLKAIR